MKVIACAENDILSNPAFIDTIRNQELEVVNLDIISDSSNKKGWKPKRRSDFVDIKLKEGYHITKIDVLEGSNVASFYLTLVDINEETKTFKVISNLIKIIF